jgi:glutamine synthetase
MNNTCILEYIWLDSNNEFKSKIRIVDNLYNFENTGWSYYDSNQKKEINLKSVTKFINPFFKINNTTFNINNPFLSRNNSYIILCVSSDFNDRHFASEINTKYISQNTLFGIKQEYLILDKTGNLPDSFKYSQINLKNKYSFSGIGNNYGFGREFAQKHLLLCLNAGINISEVNDEENGLWSFTIKPSNLLETSDHLLAARYILFKLCEEYKFIISFSSKEQIFPKCIVNISNENTRSIDGLNNINSAIYNLELYHNMKSHNQYYDVDKLGRYNEIEKYKFKIDFTPVAITFPNKNLGIFEDNRHAAYSNPYLLLGILLKEINDELNLMNIRVMSDVNYVI